MLYLNKPIQPHIIVPLSDVQRDGVKRLDNEDFGPVIRKTCEHLQERGSVASDEMMQNGIMALKQYYLVALLDPLNAHAVSRIVDEFWHAHILHTREYSSFCEDFIGAFMHHVPLDKSSSSMVSNVSDLYSYTLTILPQLFDNVDDRMWSSADTTEALICYHFGNTVSYPRVANDAHFPVHPKGSMWSFENVA